MVGGAGLDTFTDADGIGHLGSGDPRADSLQMGAGSAFASSAGDNDIILGGSANASMSGDDGTAADGWRRQRLHGRRQRQRHPGGRRGQ